MDDKKKGGRNITHLMLCQRTTDSANYEECAGVRFHFQRIEGKQSQRKNICLCQ